MFAFIKQLIMLVATPVRILVQVLFNRLSRVNAHTSGGEYSVNRSMVPTIRYYFLTVKTGSPWKPRDSVKIVKCVMLCLWHTQLKLAFKVLVN